MRRAAAGAYSKPSGTRPFPNSAFPMPQSLTPRMPEETMTPRSCPRSQLRRGGLLMFVLVSLVSLCGIVAMAVDTGRLYMEKQAAQNAADAGALAGGRDLPYTT